MNIFTEVKSRVSAAEVAKTYGLKINRNMMAYCPFHDDKHPSMKIDQTYYCLCLNQELSEVNHNLQEELRKVLTDLSDITRLNQQLSIENDNLRNRGGWMLREQQEKLERGIADVQDQNSRLNRLVNMSNVTAYEKMRRERDDALNQVAEERQKTFMAKKNFREDINKVNKKTNDKVLDMKNRMQFWQIVSIGTLIVGFLIGWIL